MGNIIGTIVSKISDIVVEIRLTFWLKNMYGAVWYHLLINGLFGVSTLLTNQPIGKAMIVKAIDKMMFNQWIQRHQHPNTKETWVKRHHLQFSTTICGCKLPGNSRSPIPMSVCILQGFLYLIRMLSGRRGT